MWFHFECAMKDGFSSTQGVAADRRTRVKCSVCTHSFRRNYSLMSFTSRQFRTICVRVTLFKWLRSIEDHKRPFPSYKMWSASTFIRNFNQNHIRTSFSGPACFVLGVVCVCMQIRRCIQCVFYLNCLIVCCCLGKMCRFCWIFGDKIRLKYRYCDSDLTEWEWDRVEVCNDKIHFEIKMSTRTKLAKYIRPKKTFSAHSIRRNYSAIRRQRAMQIQCKIDGSVINTFEMFYITSIPFGLLAANIRNRIQRTTSRQHKS